MSPLQLQTRDPGSRTYRNPFTYTFGVLLSAGFLVTLCWVMVHPGVDHRLISRSVAALILSTVAWFIWRVAGHPAVVIAPSKLIVRNPFRVHTLPWSSLGDVALNDGLEITVAGGTTVKVWGFSGSLIGELSGSRSASRAREAIEAARERGRGPSKAGAPSRQLDFGLRLLVLLWLSSIGLAILTWSVDPQSPRLTVW